MYYIINVLYINILYIINVLYINVLSINDVSWLVKRRIVVCELVTRLTLAHPPPSFPIKDKETDSINRKLTESCLFIQKPKPPKDVNAFVLNGLGDLAF